MSNKEDGTAADKLKPENQELVNKLAIEIMSSIQKVIKDARGLGTPMEIMSASQRLWRIFGGVARA